MVKFSENGAIGSDLYLGLPDSMIIWLYQSYILIAMKVF